MWYLIREIVWFLVLTALLWGAVGWWLRGAGIRSTLADMENDFASKLQSLRRSRDSYRDQLEQVQVGDEHAGAQLSARQRAQITAHVRKLEQQAQEGRAQVETLSAKLEAVTKNAQARENEYKVLRERLEAAARAVAERDARIAELTDTAGRAAANDEPAAGANAGAAPGPVAPRADVHHYEDTIAKLKARVEALRKESSQPLATAEHSKLLNVIQAQKNTIASLNDKVDKLRKSDGEAAPAAAAQPDFEAQLQRHEAAIAAREKELARVVRERAALAETVGRHEATIAELESRLQASAARPPSADTQLRKALAQHQQQAQALEKELARVREDHDTVVAAARRQKEVIEGLHRQLREHARPVPRPEPAPSQVQSGDLFEARPKVLLDAPDGEPDDLKQIHGVGPVLEAKLNELGIYHFRQIASFDDDDILWVAGQMNSFPKRIMRDRWVSQAAQLEARRRGAAT